ncbi:hypothetical protein F4778DRAFT_778356 [Xylariomycetidae sp. FL2044]|nr:hypothetical protein F4778DRAFT_778356 [Xylariomycetidae sp. FL2044]
MDDADAVFAAMMDDLGDQRLEDLATDDGRKRRRHPDHPIAPAPVPKRRVAASSSAQATISSGAKAWKAAVFDDDDSKGVQNLEAISDGNLARFNREKDLYAAMGPSLSGSMYNAT